MTETTYTAVVTAAGEGRNGGRATAADGSLDVTLAIPKELGGNGGATNPEQLLGAGWASCFLGAVKIVAAQKKVKLADLAVDADITLHNESADFWLSAALHLEVSGVDQTTAEELGHAAHQICPYSKATRGNVEVTIDATVATVA
ncbi:organic hydroperoxide resistance protein [Amycolatopsis sp. NPDC051373]|uniref:organic hydroperoxide resistance protein n=1 Tax=Amycolatopsis sp. NPDC051373 TaxID=3155801 RepID=UPI00344F8FB0